MKVFFVFVLLYSCYFTSYQIFAEELAIPAEWDSELLPNARKPRSCNEQAERRCELEFKSCLQFSIPANDQITRCDCSSHFYGICLREAGCAASRYVDCVDELMINDCNDMSICGSNCVGSGNSMDLSETRILPINNFAKNYLRFSTCDLGVDEEPLFDFEVVQMRRCRNPENGIPQEESFKICPYWIPPSTFTALAIPANTTYIRLEYANYFQLSEFSGYTVNDTDIVASVLQNPLPIEYYGTKQLWPPSIDVEYSDSNFCSNDYDCPGSTCNKRLVPNKCALKSQKHVKNSGYHYKEHAFTEES